MTNNLFHEKANINDEIKFCQQWTPYWNRTQIFDRGEIKPSAVTLTHLFAPTSHNSLKQTYQSNNHRLKHPNFFQRDRNTRVYIFMRWENNSRYPIPSHLILRFIQLIPDIQSILSSQTTQCFLLKGFPVYEYSESARANKFRGDLRNEYYLYPVIVMFLQWFIRDTTLLYRYTYCLLT